jgi:hypothetical protein
MILACVPRSSSIAKNKKGYLPYSKRETISDSNGSPVDSLAYYLPLETAALDTFYGYRLILPKVNKEAIFNRKGGTKKELSKHYSVPVWEISDTTEIKIDSLSIQWYSYELYKMGEKVLSNYFLGKTIYRLKNLPGLLAEPFVISIIADNGLIYIHTKKAEYRIEPPFIQSYDGETGALIENIIKPNPLVIDKKKQITKTAFDEFESLVNRTRVTRLPHWKKSNGFDAVNFLFEIHCENGYYYVSRSGGLEDGMDSIIQKFIEVSSLERSHYGPR